MNNRFILTPYFIDDYSAGLAPLAEAGWLLNEPQLTAGGKQQRMVILYRSLRDHVAESIERGERPVSLAGDCCTSLGVLAGLQKARMKPVLLWFDAHGDFNTWETTPSGFLGGMPLAMMVGRGEQTIPQGLALATMPESSVTLAGARDLDPGEKAALDKSAVNQVKDINLLLEMPLPQEPIWIHFDTDVLNTEEAPAMSYPAPGGPASYLIRRIFRRLAHSGRVAAISVSCWNPELDLDGQTQALVMDLLGELVV